MDINMDIVDKVVIDECSSVSTDQKHVTLKQLRDILSSCKQLTLTPFQIAILMGFSKPSKDALVDYTSFAKICKEKVNAMYKIEALRRKAQLVAVGQFRASDVKKAQVEDGKIFAAFRACDIHYNRYLEWFEY